MEIYLATLRNLFGGNQSKERPMEIPPKRTFQRFPLQVSIDGQDKFSGTVKFKEEDGNYAIYKGKYYFLEPINSLGETLTIYKITYDFGVNDVLGDRFSLTGTLIKTNSEDIAFRNIDFTNPLIQQANNQKYLPIRMDDEDGVPELKLKVHNLHLFDKYYDPTAIKGKVAQKLLSTIEDSIRGNLPTEKLKLPIFIHPSFKGKGYVPLLQTLGTGLKENHHKLKVFEIRPGSETVNIHNVLHSHARKDKEGNFLAIGTVENAFLGTTQNTTRKILDIDLSNLTDVVMLETATFDKKEINLIDVNQVKGHIIDPELTEHVLFDYVTQPNELYQEVIFEDGNTYEIPFKLGMIKNYNRITTNGELKKTQKIKVLIGFKKFDYSKINVLSSQVDFLDKYGIFTEIDGKQGNIYIPLEELDLVHEEEEGGLSPEFKEVNKTELELGEESELSKVENELYTFLADNGFEETAIALRPYYANRGYTFGESKIIRVPLVGQTKLRGQDFVRILEISLLPLKTTTSVTRKVISARYKKIYTEEEFKREFKGSEAPWELGEGLFRAEVPPGKSFMDVYTNEKPLPYFNGGYPYILITGPKKKQLPQNSQEGQKLTEQEILLDYQFRHPEIPGSDLSRYSDVYKVTSPTYLLRKWARDGDSGNPDRYSGFHYETIRTALRDTRRGDEIGGFFGTQATRRADYGTCKFTKAYQDEPYYMFIFTWQGSGFSDVRVYAYTSESDRGSSYRGYAEPRYRYIHPDLLGSILSYKSNWSKVTKVHPFSSTSVADQIHHYFQGYDGGVGTRYGTHYIYSRNAEDYQKLAEEYFDPQNKYERPRELNKGDFYVKQEERVPLNPKEINLSVLSLSDPMLSQVRGGDETRMQVHETVFFDLVGTNFYLAVKKLSDSSLTFKLILKDPELSVTFFQYKNYSLKTPLNIVDVAQVINQTNTLYFFGNLVPLKFRKKFINQQSDTFEKFQITPLQIEGFNSQYENRYLELKTSVDDIKQVFSNLKLAPFSSGDYDPVKYEQMKLQYEQTAMMRRHAREMLEMDQEAFLRDNVDQWKQYDGNYIGQGFEDGKWQQNWNYYKNLVVGGIGAGAALGATLFVGKGALAAKGIGMLGSAAAGGRALAGSLVGLGTTLGTALSQVKSLVDTAEGTGYNAQLRQKEFSKELEHRRLSDARHYTTEKYILNREKLIIENKYEEFSERQNIKALTTGISVTSPTDYHTHKALADTLKLGDIYLIVSYPDGWLLDKLKEHYRRYGYDTMVLNFLLDSNLLPHIGPNIQFSFIKDMNITNPVIRANIEMAFLNGIYLRPLRLN